MEDRASGRMNVMAAMIARIRRAAHNAMMLGHRLALLAVDAFWIQAIAKPSRQAASFGNCFGSLSGVSGCMLGLRLFGLYLHSGKSKYVHTVKG